MRRVKDEKKRQDAWTNESEDRHMRILFPFLMYGEYSDGSSAFAGGENEEDCIERLATLGELVYYTCVTDEDYFCGQRRVDI